LLPGSCGMGGSIRYFSIIPFHVIFRSLIAPMNAEFKSVQIPGRKAQKKRPRLMV